MCSKFSILHFAQPLSAFSNPKLLMQLACALRLGAVCRINLKSRYLSSPISTLFFRGFFFFLERLLFSLNLHHVIFYFILILVELTPEM